jgi:hypothetical protein
MTPVQDTSRVMAPIASPPAVDLDQGVIEEARRRQRRRRSAVLGIVLAAAVVALGGILASRDGPAVTPHAGSGAGARPASVSRSAGMFTREPDVGLACHVPNWIACDRVGLAVWLRRPAVSVSATIAGSPLKLGDRTWSGPARNGKRTMFAGFLHPAGLLSGALKVHPDRGRYYWIGSHPLFATVRVTAFFGGGQTASSSTRVQVRPGWG